MARVDLWGYFHMDPKSVNKANKDFVGKFEKMGRDAGEGLAKEIEGKAPRIRRAMLGVADAAAAQARSVRELDKAQAERNKTTERELQLGRSVEEQKSRIIAAGKSEVVLDNQLKAARKQVENATAKLTDREAEHEALRRRSIRTTDMVQKGDLVLRQMRLDGLRATEQYKAIEQELMPLRREAQGLATKLKDSERDLTASRDHLRDLTAEAGGVERDLGNARTETASATNGLKKLEGELNKTREDAAKLDNDIIQRNKDVERSNAKREDSIKKLHETEEAENKRRRGGGAQKRGSMGVVGNMLTDLPFVPSGRAGAVIGSAMLITLASVAEAAVTASQSLALLPAIAAAGGAAFGTLALGVSGFGEAIKNMGDPKKFAEALQSLSPAAQQAALEIKYLAEGPLKDLKQATQETLFKNFAERLHNLTNQLLPSVQQLTSGVAGSFNNMFANFTGQLSTPESLGSINDIINNIVASFQKLEPAVAPFTSAMLKIVETGSSFLPQFATEIANAAQQFSNFISKAQATGSLREFMQKGIDAAKALGGVIWDVGARIYETFGNKSPEEFRKTLEDVVDAAFGIVNGITAAARAINELLIHLAPVTNLLKEHPGLVWAVVGAWAGFKALGLAATVMNISNAFGLLPAAADKGAAGIIAKFGRGGPVFVALLGILALIDDMIARQADFEKRAAQYNQDVASGMSPQEAGNRLRPGLGDMPLPKKGDLLYEQIAADARDGKIPGLTVDKDGNLVNAPTPPGQPSWGDQVRPNQSRIDDHKAGVPTPATAGLPPYSPFEVPGMPPEASDSKRRDGIRAGLDPNSFMPDIGNLGAMTPGAPGAPGVGPGNQTLGPLQIGTGSNPLGKPGYGAYLIDQNEVNKAAYDVIKQARDVRDARMDLAVLQKDSLATEYELLHAREKVQDEEEQLRQKQIDLMEAQQGKWKKAANGVTSGMDELSAGLDKDLGISKGLAGLADNLVRFLGNLATAPLQAALNKVKAANPNEGSGLVGIAAAQGTFGYQFTPQGIAAGGGSASYSPSAYLNRYPYGGGGGYGAYPGDAALLANVPSGQYTQERRGDLTQGLADCSSAVEDLVNLMDGRPTGGASMSTGNAAEWLTARGFLPGMGGPGDMRVGWNSGHMQATLPGGTNFNWGSAASAAARGMDGGSGAYDPSFTSHYYRPAGAGPTIPIAAPSAPVATATRPATPWDNGIPQTADPSLTGGPIPSAGQSGPGQLPGSPLAANFPGSQPYAPTQQPQQQPGWQPSGGGGGGGGILGAAMGAASMGLDMMAPGSGAAAQIASQAIQRTIKYGGQVAGSLAQGALDFFSVSDPDGGGGSDLTQSWLGRAASSLASAAPALPQTAGKQDKQPQQPQNGQQGQQGQQGAPGGPTVNIESFVQAENRNSQQTVNDLALQAYSTGLRG